jgi:SAM-dependent methyltransferase
MLNVAALEKTLYNSRPGYIDAGHRFAEFVRSHINRQMIVLDLGAGRGKPGPVNYRADAKMVVGVDPDAAIMRNPFVHGRVQAPAEQLPFRTGSFDLVFSDWVVEHLPSPKQAVIEVYRVLKPGGRFIFRTGNLLHYSYAIARLTPHWFHLKVANWARGLPKDTADPYPTYYRMNTPRTVHKLLTAAGFIREALLMWEPSPSYLRFSAVAFLLGVGYERLMNRFEALKPLRAFIIVCYRKPEN